MDDFFEVDFLDVETSKSGDAITIRYQINGTTSVHVVDGGYTDTGDKIVGHIKKHYGSTDVDHVVLTHPDQDHANGLRKVLEGCQVGALWMNRPWLYAEELLPRFSTYKSVDALRARLREAYKASAELEDIAHSKSIPVYEAFQGSSIGSFTILSPTRAMYLDLIVESDKTPEASASKKPATFLDTAASILKEAARMVRAAWGEENFPESGTSSENEMSVVQFAYLNGRKIVLTADAGRRALSLAADYAPSAGLTLPGVDDFQVPHHGGRHNVSTEILDRWLGKRLAVKPEVTRWRAVCSSAKADEDHPRKSVVRAMLHRGAHFSATEGRDINLSANIKREGWLAVPQTDYPAEQEE